MSRLERALVDLGRHIHYPEVPDLAPAVVLRVRTRATAPRRLAVLVAATTALLVGGLAALSPAVRAAILRSFVLPGIRIVVGGPAPEASVRPLGHGLDLGERVDPSQARAAVDFAIRAPRELGPPDLVYLDGSRIWLVYRARPGLPAAEETGVGLLVTEFRGSVDESLLKKVTMEGGTVTPIQVDGNRGYYVEGAHSLLFLDGSGNVIEERTRVAGNVLVWEEGGVTYRLESALGLGESVAIAGSMA